MFTRGLALKRQRKRDGISERRQVGDASDLVNAEEGKPSAGPSGVEGSM
jgi:hypothetical protein